MTLIEQETLTDQFEAFLNGILFNVRATGEQHLVSYAVEWETGWNEQAVRNLDAAYHTLLFWREPENGAAFLAAGETLKVVSRGVPRFQRLRSEIERWRTRHLSNIEGESSGIPLFVGTTAFFQELKDVLWRDFAPLHWFIPEILLCRRGDRCQLVFNFLVSADTSIEELSTVYDQRLDLLEKARHGSAATNGRHSKNGIQKKDRDEEQWREAVSEALRDIRAASYEKIVLSRRIAFPLSETIPTDRWIGRLEKAHPGCYVFLLKSGESRFLGASPERLAKFSDGIMDCNAVAGSIRRGDTADEDEALGEALLMSEKNLVEHRFVIDHLRSVMEEFCADIQVDASPSLRKLPYIQHLHMRICGKLKAEASIADVLDRVHPTPAVGGYPAKQVLPRIAELETYDRGLYAGICGWLNFDGEGDFCVSIRSALVTGEALYTFAGAGIVEGSDPQSELEETEIKVQAITSLLLH